MKFLLFILLQLQLIFVSGQIPLPAFENARKDTATFLQYLPVKADFIFIFSAEGYWQSDTESYRLLVQEGEEWSAWTYYRKWKNASAFNNKGDKPHKYFFKKTSLGSRLVTELFDSLGTVNFWSLCADSLNQTNGYDISDAVDYIFRIESPAGCQELDSYAPEYYLEKFPGMQQRAQFLKSIDIFNRWWKRNTEIREEVSNGSR
ncbi:MAG: hypothetical protein JNM88_18375 [Chitinophagaceae bacterium]|nr:hypothetical protein [Chitinophagaceae bacterium]